MLSSGSCQVPLEQIAPRMKDTTSAKKNPENPPPPGKSPATGSKRAWKPLRSLQVSWSENGSECPGHDSIDKKKEVPRNGRRRAGGGWNTDESSDSKRKTTGKVGDLQWLTTNPLGGKAKENTPSLYQSRIRTSTISEAPKIFQERVCDLDEGKKHSPCFKIDGCTPFTIPPIWTIPNSPKTSGYMPKNFAEFPASAV